MNEDRTKVWSDYIAQGGEPHRIVSRMFLNYHRYYEAQFISQWFIEHKIKMDFDSLDYGCGVGDYGFYLLRQGAKSVAFYDYPRAINFVKYRLQSEKLAGGKVIDADVDGHPDFNKYDLVIFGEVLEHLDNPLDILGAAINTEVKYIFTSSYPYRSDDPSDPYWNNHDHSDLAREVQKDCRQLLEDNYNYAKFEGELRLWSLK